MKIISQNLIERLENNGYNTYTGYSGRCMFGRTCFGIAIKYNDFKFL